MVSTRGHRYKFSEGERVLCYEPDLTKAKVLYDSKVLEVIEAKDKRGRRSVEYLIHFQGWNSSWDRCVSEDFVLKDTEENRQLQKTLAEKSQLQLGAYLYRRRGGSTSAAAGSSSGNTASAGRRNRTAFEDEGSSSSSRHPEDEGTRSDSSGTNSSGHISAEPRPCEMPSPASAPIALGPGLRDRLTMDYHLVTKRGRLAWLPARPNVLEVLQACVRHHIARAATATPRPRRPRTGPAQPDLQQHLRRLNLMREVADGLRIYFDFILKDQLLYEQEEAQYQDNITKKIMRDPRAPQKNEDEGKVAPEEYAHLPPSPAEEGPDTPARRLRSHKSPTSTPQPMEVTEEPSTKDIPGPSSVETPPASIDGSSYPELNGTTAEVFRRALDWRIVPPDHPPYPTAIYGATHLARLFVKLPEYLSLIVMPEAKLKLIIEYVEIFVQFLEDHEEWFGESFYYDTNPSTS